MRTSLFLTELDGVTYERWAYEAHKRADEAAREAEEWAAESQAELEAERAAERFFEDRGYEAARAQEAYELPEVLYFEREYETDGIKIQVWR